MLDKNSLRFRIFLSMTFLVLVAFTSIAIVMVFQYRKQAQEYHIERLLDKETQIKTQIQYVLSQTTFPVQTEYIPLIFRYSIYDIANILNVNFDLYDLSGNLLKSSKAVLDDRKDSLTISKSVLQKLSTTIDKRFSEQKEIDGRGFQSAYCYVTDSQFKPIAIMHIPHFENDTFNEKALKGSLYNISVVYFSLLIVALFLAYLISRYITKSLKTIEKRLEKTRLLERNEKIILHSPSTEIEKLVSAYNGMIDEIEKSKILLAKSEREQAWREMAKQVAHEIKNPLTPMRLSVQSFQRKFFNIFNAENSKSENIKNTENTEKLNEFCESLIQQIDILSNIASAFSTLTNMPEKNDEWLDCVPIIRRTLDIFDNPNIYFMPENEQVSLFFDKDQFVRIITNLVKNAIQATENQLVTKIIVSISKKENGVKISVSDNGVGICEKYKEKIFEPKFTTKTSGSGLGLAMVKNIVSSYGGTIEVKSEEGKGSVFIIKFPL